MPKKKKKIEKPWCMYCHGTPTGIGKIVEESESSAEVIKYEGQSSEVWDKKSLRRFTTVTGAIKEFRRWREGYQFSMDELKRVMVNRFPSQRKAILKIKE